MEAHFNRPDGDLPRYNGESYMSYKKNVLEYCNKLFFMLTDSALIGEITTDEHDEITLLIRTRSECETVFSDWEVIIDGEKVNAFDLWLKDPCKKKYKELIRGDSDLYIINNYLNSNKCNLTIS